MSTSALIEDLDESRLPHSDVEIAVAYESLAANYKDGLVLNRSGGLVKTYPHVPGIDQRRHCRPQPERDQFQPRRPSLYADRLAFTVGETRALVQRAEEGPRLRAGAAQVVLARAAARWR